MFNNTNDIMFAGWVFERMSFDTAKKKEELMAVRHNFEECYSLNKEGEFIYILEEFLTTLNKISKAKSPINNKENIKKFLIKNNLLLVM